MVEHRDARPADDMSETAPDQNETGAADDLPPASPRAHGTAQAPAAGDPPERPDESRDSSGERHDGSIESRDNGDESRSGDTAHDEPLTNREQASAAAGLDTNAGDIVASEVADPDTVPPAEE